MDIKSIESLVATATEQNKKMMVKLIMICQKKWQITKN